jgi:hypothetical protein
MNTIKKTIAISIVFLLLTSGSFAQSSVKVKDNPRPSPIVEFWGGMGLTTALGTVSSTDYRLGGLFGAGFSLPISQQNYIHFELAYTFQGFKYGSDSVTNNDVTYKAESKEQRFNYFKVIVMDKYFIDKKKVLYVNGGLYAAYLSQARFQATYYTDPENTNLGEIDSENNDDFNPYDFGVEGGVGVRLGNKQLSNFTIEARASYGIINAAKQNLGTGNNFYAMLKLGFDIPVRSK